jgi:hypothetical protein
LPHDKYAPKTLQSTAKPREIRQFLEVYEHLCTYHGITDEGEKCKGIVSYCTSKVAGLIEKIPSYVTGDFNQLVKDIRYFIDNDDNSYSLTQVESFTKQWRRKKLDSLESFKKYHRKFIELVGIAIGAGTIHQSQYNRYFWEGIHHTLRGRIEERMLIADPSLDTSVPFDMNKVIKAAEAILNRKRFDQHLLRNSGYHSSETDSEQEEYRPSQSLSDSEEDKDQEEENYNRSRKAHHKSKLAPPRPVTPPKPRHVVKKSNEDMMSKLTQQMGELKISIARSNAELHSFMGSARNQANPNQPFGVLSQKNPNLYNNNLPRRSQFNPPPAQFGQPSFNNRQPRRELPPHVSAPVGVSPNQQEPFCFGCGTLGHRIGQCNEIEALLKQGTIGKNAFGRFCWPDGTPVYKEKEESWLQAINKVLKRSNVIAMERQEESDEGEVEEIEVEREDSDASSEDQKDLGWSPRSISDSYALGAERNYGVSRMTRKQAQDYPLGRTQRMQEFPQRRNNEPLGRQGPPIHKTIYPNSHQSGPLRRPTPINVDQHKFEGKKDHQFLPMDIDQGPSEKPGNNHGKVTTNQGRGNVSKPSNPGPVPENVSSKITQKLMEKEITIRMDEIAQIAPSVRQDLLRALKEQRGVLRQGQERKERNENEKTVLWSSALGPFTEDLGEVKFDVRDDLPTISAQVGQAQMVAVIDSGSQVNVMSEKFMRKCCLPIRTDNTHQYRITGIDGGPAVCMGVIPEADILVTERKIPTTGEIVVVKNAIFDLILGRPWTTGNGANLLERPEGTYLEIWKGKKHYVVNVCPNLYRRVT